MKGRTVEGKKVRKDDGKKLTSKKSRRETKSIDKCIQAKLSLLQPFPPSTPTPHLPHLRYIFSLTIDNYNYHGNN